MTTYIDNFHNLLESLIERLLLARSQFPYRYWGFSESEAESFGPKFEMPESMGLTEVEAQHLLKGDTSINADFRAFLRSLGNVLDQFMITWDGEFRSYESLKNLNLDSISDEDWWPQASAEAPAIRSGLFVGKPGSGLPDMYSFYALGTATHVAYWMTNNPDETIDVKPLAEFLEDCVDSIEGSVDLQLRSGLLVLKTTPGSLLSAFTIESWFALGDNLLNLPHRNYCIDLTTEQAEKLRNLGFDFVKEAH